jgi:hypothetical protein
MEKVDTNIMHEISVIFIALIVAFFIYRAYAYLGNLDNCKCAPTKIVQNLKMIELYYLFIVLAGIVFNIIYLIFNINYTKLISKNSYLVGFIMIYILSVFGVYLFYIYNVIEFKSQLDPKCGCANQWQNNIIYIHVLYLSLPIILTILSALFKFKINISIITLSLVILAAIYFYEQYLVGEGKIKESMVSMLGNYSDMVFEPTIYDQDGTPYDNGPQNPNYGDFSPKIGQPLQQYHQMRPEEYPSFFLTENIIQTPLSSHEAIIKDYRSKMPNILFS